MLFGTDRLLLLQGCSDHHQFPRALVYIDEQNIDVSPECKKELSGLSDAARAVDQDKGQPKNADLIRNAINLRERFFTRFGTESQHEEVDERLLTMGHRPCFRHQISPGRATDGIEDRGLLWQHIG